MKRRVTLGSFAMFVVTLLLVIASAPYAKDHIATRRCGERLVAISQAARVWADAHNGRLPTGFIMMSNELVTPRILICPSDKSRDSADNWGALTSANSSYQIWDGAPGAKDLPLEILQAIPYLQCKVHGGNHANALGQVSVYIPRIPATNYFLAGLAMLILLGNLWWYRYKPFRAQLPVATAAGDLFRSIEQVRYDYLAARGRAPSPWYRKGLLAAARRAMRALPFFRDKKGEPQGRENLHTT